MTRTTGYTFRTSDRRPTYRSGNKDDPKEYGFICPHCTKRYGAKHPLGVIEVMRCVTCPSLKEAIQVWDSKKKVNGKANRSAHILR